MVFVFELKPLYDNLKFVEDTPVEVNVEPPSVEQYNVIVCAFVAHCLQVKSIDEIYQKKEKRGIANS